MTFAHPWFLLLLLALPWIAWLRRRRARDTAFLYSSVNLVKGVVSLRRSRASIVLRQLRWLALVALIVALARPRLGEGEVQVTASGIDIVVAVDFSMSMAAEDFELVGRRANRVAAAKDVLEKFINRRPNDRIGLVAFAGRAYVAAPLTLDHAFLLERLEQLRLGVIEDGTAIGSAITAGLNRLRELKSKSRILIVMTDGQNNAGKVPPMTAAEAAQALGVKVYTIGVGTRGVAPYPQTDAFGQVRYVPMNVDIDEDLLVKIAETTGGKYFRAVNTQKLRAIYDDIDQLEKTTAEVKKYQRYQEVFAWFAVPGLVLLLLEIILGHTVWRKLP
ncbi:MAG: VWA domain-containing protein [Verrucomicrobiales bacterium]|nr:VWA domain-containing protein [Verrucomicrobiales bacterium]